MKNKITGLSILLFIVMSSSFNVDAQITGNPIIFSPDDGYEFSSFAKSNLIWPEGKKQIVELNITLKLIPENISIIYIVVIAYIFIEIVGGTHVQRDIVQDVPGLTLSISNTTLLINQTLFPPDRVDNFYLNITMLVGTSRDRTARDQTIRFPDTGTIFVDRDKLVPLVNLYGFPPSSFFAKFLPMYGLILGIMVVPGVYYSITSLMQKSKRNTKISDDGDDQTDD